MHQIRSVEGLARQRDGVSRADRRTLVAVAAGILALHLAGWALLVFALIPGRLSDNALPVGAGVGLTAYILGARHAFDADHIAAIDNVTRRLVALRPHRPLSVGFFFAAGHSTVVLILAIVLALGFGGIVGAALGEGSPIRVVSSVLGSAVSGTFLLVVAWMNIRALIRQGTRERESGGPTGILLQLVRRPLRLVSRARHMYAVGFLFGLGFDTATEVGLLVIAVTSVAGGVPWYGVLCLPILFAAGMVLFDSLDGIFVSFAYAWALGGQGSKRRYNVIVTVASAVVALAVGVTEELTAVVEGVSARGPVSVIISDIDPGLVGAIIAISLALVCVAVLIVRRTTRLDIQQSKTPAVTQSRD
jgi:nickel/cobalt transporter (NiCoT) family protein